MRRKSPFVLEVKPSRDEIKEVIDAMKISRPDARSCFSFFWIISDSKSAECRFGEIIVDASLL